MNAATVPGEVLQRIAGCFNQALTHASPVVNS
jgi:hypothetical protein